MIAVVWFLSFAISCPLLFGLNNTGRPPILLVSPSICVSEISHARRGPGAPSPLSKLRGRKSLRCRWELERGLGGAVSGYATHTKGI